MQLLVKTLAGKLININVEPSETISLLKLKIYNLDGMEVEEQLLIYEGKQLQNEHILFDYDAHDGSILYLISKNYTGKTGLPYLYIKTISGKMIVLDYEMDHTVLEIKRKIESKEGIPEQQQRLIFAGKQLEDDRTLSDYGVQRQCTFHLLLKK